MERATIDRLDGLGRLWGVIEWFHPELGRRDVGLQEAALEAARRVLAGVDRDGYRAAAQLLTGATGDPATGVFDDADYEAGKSRGVAVDTADDGEAEPGLREVDGVALLRLADFNRVHWSHMGEKAREVFDAAAASAALVVDMRSVPAPLGKWLPGLCAGLVQVPLDLPAHRHRVHSGYEGDLEAPPSYVCGYFVSGGGRWKVGGEGRGSLAWRSSSIPIRSASIIRRATRTSAWKWLPRSVRQAPRQSRSVSRRNQGW